MVYWIKSNRDMKSNPEASVIRPKSTEYGTADGDLPNEFSDINPPVARGTGFTGETAETVSETGLAQPDKLHNAADSPHKIRVGRTAETIDQPE